jgi:integrase
LTANLEEFKDWLVVVKQYAPATTAHYVKRVKHIFRTVPTFDYAHLLAHLKELRAHASPGHYSNVLGALKVYSRFIGRPELLEEFDFPHHQLVPKTFYSREQVQRFYSELTTLKMRALFLMGATTGLRKDEILSLRIDDIDHTTRMITPLVHSGRTTEGRTASTAKPTAAEAWLQYPWRACGWARRRRDHQQASG